MCLCDLWKMKDVKWIRLKCKMLKVVLEVDILKSIMTFSQSLSQVILGKATHDDSSGM